MVRLSSPHKLLLSHCYLSSSTSTPHVIPFQRTHSEHQFPDNMSQTPLPRSSDVVALQVFEYESPRSISPVAEPASPYPCSGEKQTVEPSTPVREEAAAETQTASQSVESAMSLRVDLAAQSPSAMADASLEDRDNIADTVSNEAVLPYPAEPCAEAAGRACDATTTAADTAVRADSHQPTEPEAGHKRPREEAGAEDTLSHEGAQNLPSSQPSVVEGSQNARARLESQQDAPEESTATSDPPMEGSAVPTGCPSRSSASEAGTPTPTLPVDEKRMAAEELTQGVEVPQD